MKAIEAVLYRVPYAGFFAPAIMASLYALMFWLAQTYETETLPSYMSSRAELLGLMMVLILNPSFLIGYVITAQRRSMRFAQELFALRVIPESPEVWLRPIRARGIMIGAGFGALYGLTLNTPSQWLLNILTVGSPTQSIVVGQVVLWSVVGVVLSIRINTAMAFNRVGRGVQANILDTSAYARFARTSTDDVLAIVVLLVLSTVQALDAQFRFGNYFATMLVAIPAATFLFLLPMLGIRQQLIASRDEHLDRVEQEIDGLTAASSANGTDSLESLESLESLLQHRDRIRETFLWPVNRSVGSRLAVYVIIPPIAWLGSAFVELGVGRILGSE